MQTTQKHAHMQWFTVGKYVGKSFKSAGSGALSSGGNLTHAPNPSPTSDVSNSGCHVFNYIAHLTGRRVVSRKPCLIQLVITSVLSILFIERAMINVLQQ